MGEDEANLTKRKLSVLSPLARALIGKKIGDAVEIRTPGGIRECEIIDIGR